MCLSFFGGGGGKTAIFSLHLFFLKTTRALNKALVYTLHTACSYSWLTDFLKQVQEP